MHLVGIYSVNSISLYIDGTQVATKTIDPNFKFANTSLDLQIGPTSDAGDSFVVDAPAVYRYGLNAASINRHYNDANYYIQPIHVVTPEEGVLFSCSDRTNKIDFSYTYGVDTPWDNFVDSDTYYDDKGKYLAFIPTTTVESKSFVINDFLFIPMESAFTDSKIEWRNESGVIVETSVDGTNYSSCVNGEAIPQYKKGGDIKKDDNGYWNPDNWGKPVEIDSNMITMQGVYEPLLGISDTGDTKLMKPGKNYKFKGKKVREYPVGKLGINQLDAQPMKKLNQLLNFTNNPDKDNWLDKYN
jgi:hypothetical protein